MEITQTDFDNSVIYTLRIELLNGKVILYTVDTENKQYLMKKLMSGSDGMNEMEDIRFLWFETSLKRMVILHVNSIVRITFCFDFPFQVINPNSYYDNFDLILKETSLEEKEIQDGEVRLHVIEDEYLPQAIVYHTGKASDELYDNNPSTYSSLSKGCLAGLTIELEGDCQLRQFINLTDDDGEETFIPLVQIMVMEFDNNLVFEEEEEDLEDLFGDE